MKIFLQATCAVGLMSLPGNFASAADATAMGLIKLRQFEQTPGAGAAPASTNGYSFQAFVLCSTNGSVTNATVTFKLNGVAATRELQPLADGLGLRFEDRFQTQAALDAAYPAGGAFSVVEYTNTLGTVHDGVRKVNLSFWIAPPFAAISAPGTPQVSNLPEAQAIDGSRDFILRWDSVGSSLTLLQLTVLDAKSNVVFATPLPFSDGALNGASNSVAIPARTLPVGSAFEAHLVAVNTGIPNTNTYAGAIAVAALAKDTRFPLATLRPEAPMLSISSSSSGGVELHLLGPLNHEHEIQASDRLSTWSVLVSTNLTTGELKWVDAASRTNAQRYYRAAVVR